jgi:hypothetical protein
MQADAYHLVNGGNASPCDRQFFSALRQSHAATAVDADRFIIRPGLNP